MSLLCSLGGFLHFGTLEATAEKEGGAGKATLPVCEHSLAHSLTLQTPPTPPPQLLLQLFPHHHH